MAAVPGPGGSNGDGAFCRWCGRATADCDGTTGHRELDPPRFCPACGRRLRVLVHPGGWEASCRDHGPVR